MLGLDQRINSGPLLGDEQMSLALAKEDVIDPKQPSGPVLSYIMRDGLAGRAMRRREDVA